MDSCREFSELYCLQLPRIQISGSSSEPDSTEKKDRCKICAKKFIALPGFRCCCGQTLCINHRLPEEHDCFYDFKRLGRVALEKNNPICIADKLMYRI